MIKKVVLVSSVETDKGLFQKVNLLHFSGKSQDKANQ